MNFINVAFAVPVRSALLMDMQQCSGRATRKLVALRLCIDAAVSEYDRSCGL